MKSAGAVLLLEDGTRFDGQPFGEVGEATGETVFYTGVVGYQEVITNPSYRGTLAVLTYPIIGSYGINSEDQESPRPQVGGVVVDEYSPCFSNFRATGSLEEFLQQHHVIGIRQVDTRAVTIHLREHGEKRGIIASGDFDEEALLKKLREVPSPFENDLVSGLPSDEAPGPRGEEKHKLVVLNLGVKRSFLDQLGRLGCSVALLPSTARADELLAGDSQGVILAGGPGDPRVLKEVIETARSLLGKRPIFGVGLGHQLLALALGGEVRRLKTGHHGVNHPVREVATRRCEITVQHHSFVVDENAVPDTAEITHVSLNDGTVEGIRSKEFAAGSVQFHPGPDEMGRPCRRLRELVESSQSA